MPKRQRKKAAKPRARKPSKPDLAEEIISKAVLLLISLRDEADVRAACSAELGADAATIGHLVAEAKRRIVLAAKFDRAEELGKAAQRSDQLYEMAVSTNDYTAGNSIERDRRRLLDLYPRLTGPTANTDSQATTEAELELERILGYLAPLNLAAEGTPGAELVRLAVERIIGG